MTDKANQCAFPADARTMTDGGMTMREYYAGQALNGIMANQNTMPTEQYHFDNIAEDALRAADALLSALANES